MNALASVGPDRILDLTYAFRRARLLAAAVEFAIFTVLGREGPLGVAALAARCGLHARAARDALDALVALGLLLRDDRGLYANGPDAARWLDEGSSDCIAALVRMVDGNERQTWSRLTEALRTGDRQVTSNGPGSGFTALLADPVRLARFAAGMSAGTLPAARALALLPLWGGVRRVLDLGTAEGCLAVSLAATHAHLRIDGLDLPAMCPLFDAFAHRHGVADRVRFVAADFLRDPLPEADVVVMGRVLHNWDLPTRLQLLQRARAVLPPGGILLVYEAFIDDDRSSAAHALLSSLNMLLATEGGADFSAAECAGWLRGAGFDAGQLIPLAGPFSAMVATRLPESEASRGQRPQH